MFLAALNDELAPLVFPASDDGSNPRACPKCGKGSLSLRLGTNGAFVGCSNYPECNFTRSFGGSDGAEDTTPKLLGREPQSGENVTLRFGPHGAYLQIGEGRQAKSVSLSNDMPPASVDVEVALRLLSLPRNVGDHPVTGKPITAGINRRGPFVVHDGNYASLNSTDEVLNIDLVEAVTRLASPTGQGRRRGSRAPLKVLGVHSRTNAEIRLMAGQYGPYVTDGTINATLPNSVAPDQLTLEKAVELIDERAAKGPSSSSRGRRPRRPA
jgi:DNA topoisomerase I